MPHNDVLDVAVVWKVWVGSYTDPVLVLMPTDASVDDIARTGKVGMLDKHMKNVREEHREYDEKFWTDAVAAKDITRIERGDDVRLSPRIHVVKAHDYPLEPAFASGESQESSE